MQHPDMDSSVLCCGKLPLHHFGQSKSSILKDEDFAQAIQLHLQGIVKEEYIRAQDIVNFISTPEMQQKLDDANTRFCCEQWVGDTERRRMVCILMDMNRRMW